MDTAGGRELEVHNEDALVTLESDVGTITGTPQQIAGLATENARRQRGDRPKFEPGEQLDI